MKPYLLALPALVAAFACGSSKTVACRVGADCASGVCRSDGTCMADSGTATTSTSSSSSGQGGSSSSTSSSASSGGSSSSSGGVCAPNDDGSITREEVPLQAGLHATFRVAENAPVDTAGAMQMDGSRAWDLTPMLSGDHGELVETLSTTGAWYAAQFGGASYAARLSDTSDLLGVFQINSDALVLMGVVSPSDGATKTELTYSPAVTILAFPLKDGATWQTTATVNGTAQGIPVFYSEVYSSKVDAHGTMKTPFGDFAVQRIRTDLVRTIGALVTTKRTFGFAAECFGTIATMVSKDNELAMEFTTAAEVSRLSP